MSDPVIRIKLRSLERYVEKVDPDISELEAQIPKLAEMLRQWRSGTLPLSDPYLHDEEPDV